MRPGDPRATQQLSGALAGAVDLAAVKARVEARDRAPSRAAPGGVAGGVPDGLVVDVTEETFQSDVLDRSLQVPVILDLWATWCEPCKALSPVLEKLAAEGAGAWVLAKIDVDASPTLAQALRVQSIPAVKAVFSEQLVAEFSGALPEADVRTWITALLDAVRAQQQDPAAAPPDADESTPQPQTDPRFAPAEEALDRGDFAAAEASLAGLVAQAPADATATAMLRGVQLHRRASEAPADAVDHADSAPDDVEAALDAADVQVAAGQVSDGLTRLVQTVRRTAGDERDRVRGRLLELFVAVGDDDPDVATARRALSAALF